MRGLRKVNRYAGKEFTSGHRVPVDPLAEVNLSVQLGGQAGLGGVRPAGA